MVLERKEPTHFGAGPAQVPTKVLQKAAQDLINFQGIGLGIGEISHRSKEATEVIENSKSHLKQLLEIPDSYDVFFIQGGGTTGFSSIASNLTAASLARTGKVGTAAYIVTGTWSEKAAQEAERLGVPTECIFNTKKETGKYTTIPNTAEWVGKLSVEKHSYVYLCENETVHGVEWPEVPEELAALGIPVVADLSSDILSRKIDVERYSVIMAGLQKNVGLAGLTLYIVRKSLLKDISRVSDKELLEARVPVTPIAVHYPTVAKNNSAYNTIPLFTLHVMDLVIQDLIERGGIAEQQKRNEEKASLLYNSLDKFPDFYALPVDMIVRSKMNVVFTIKKEGLDESFLKEAQALGLTGLKGHRSVGGFRASLYNVVELDSVKKLADFVTAFAQKHA